MQNIRIPETLDALYIYIYIDISTEYTKKEISQIGFICYAKINCNAHKKSSKNLTKIEYKIKKWVDYEKQEKARNSLPFYIL